MRETGCGFCSITHEYFPNNMWDCIYHCEPFRRMLSPQHRECLTYAKDNGCIDAHLLLDKIDLLID
jgi:hypothetical protein